MNYRVYILLFVIALSFGACSVNKDFMFKTDAEYAFNVVPRDTVAGEFILAPNDIFVFELYSNEGSAILEAFTTRERVFLSGIRQNNQFRILPDGTAELPVIGEIDLAGLTIPQAQTLLESRYEERIVGSYCQIRVLNRRVLVFNGVASQGAVVGLESNNIRLIEALALAGGLGDRANASKIKIIRNAHGKSEVYRVDLSTIDGIQAANMVVENGDIIYVESTPNLAREALNDIAPVVSILSSVAVIVALISRF